MILRRSGYGIRFEPKDVATQGVLWPVEWFRCVSVTWSCWWRPAR